MVGRGREETLASLECRIQIPLCRRSRRIAEWTLSFNRPTCPKRRMRYNSVVSDYHGCLLNPHLPRRSGSVQSAVLRRLPCLRTTVGVPNEARAIDGSGGESDTHTIAWILCARSSRTRMRRRDESMGDILPFRGVPSCAGRSWKMEDFLEADRPVLFLLHCSVHSIIVLDEEGNLRSGGTRTTLQILVICLLL
ncbi:hypothetical protein MPTK1_8g03050 [Marchantia polymorpha subsp. ruderalis]|uniref:Uncharacterized protein n=1 Tax=Marchantia polymorpha TaxID=3197 RepID=A0A2R6XJ52_MARPO|nr:hypothetical protein MARPO_0012s0098 [Marchantia polymorpha]BBN18506.1 hypothetical protein Mp_8g03050 [Marchantia polymorpha subsp. ruderalis]|eukprot:PTQ46150.1 hypothetical protein MARPO_0012s0098 [Marchantia polymorpha]